MLEIIFVFWYRGKLAGIARSKGLSGAWGLLGMLTWFGAEICGCVIGGIADMGVGAYVLALGMAIVSAVLLAAIVDGLPDATGEAFASPQMAAVR